jgi:hypothetical protein
LIDPPTPVGWETRVNSREYFMSRFF